MIWRVPKRISGKAHEFKYRLALVVDDVCVLRFDNKSGKGDHKHVGTVEVPYANSARDAPVARCEASTETGLERQKETLAEQLRASGIEPPDSG